MWLSDVCSVCDCAHQSRREIANPETTVDGKLLLETRLWFCNDCGEKWTTTTKLGDVSSIELRINLKA